MRYEKSCGAIIYRDINDEIEYLLLRSARKDKFWGFAKGHMENKETEEETCIREVFEEAGIKIKIKDGFRIGDRYKAAEDIDKEVILFLGNANEQSVSIQKEEIMEYRWCNYDDAMQLLTFESSKRMLAKAHEFLVHKKAKREG
ncbi:MAG TPA: NUDIX domain-containing protein [Clostridiales bacterium]|nr:NUDIX domain-containing protein [Clostridiales bacterium]